MKGGLFRLFVIHAVERIPQRVHVRQAHLPCKQEVLQRKGPNRQRQPDLAWKRHAR
eukprot:CAMPEP_0171901726 /NCGR_PEP_ID=MMETSP0993-20121228/621_1 /TAXON_ID=483369 /ORGANISM="non described non described, Strain CCMP2098" /LENGTH=55 /DNA_ID=CAMNT_0012530579 /DNA_START=57 /DNA_END=221 /DNA_ORIENTATION=-